MTGEEELESDSKKIEIVTPVGLAQAGGVSKNVLGRGLGRLMEEPKKPDVSGGEGESAPAAEPQVTPGMGSLLRGARRSPENLFAEPKEEPQANPKNPFQAPAKRPIPTWYFFAADVLLVAVGLLVVYANAETLTWGQTLFGIGAVLFGGLLAAAGVFLSGDGGAK